MSAPSFHDIAHAQYVMLTTFKKSGAPVGTPVWIAPDPQCDCVPDEARCDLFVWTNADAWKVKRVINNPNVTLAKCDARGGRVGESIPATAVSIAAEDSDYGKEAIVKKYKLLGWLGIRLSTLFRGKLQSSVLRISVPVS